MKDADIACYGSEDEWIAVIPAGDHVRLEIQPCSDATLTKSAARELASRLLAAADDP